jgi:hypothetical protein
MSQDVQTAEDKEKQPPLFIVPTDPGTSPAKCLTTALNPVTFELEEVNTLARVRLRIKLHGSAAGVDAVSTPPAARRKPKASAKTTF